LLRVLQERVQVLGLVLGKVFVEEVKFGQNIDQVDFSCHVLLEKQDILELLVELSNKESVRLLLLSLEF